MKSHVIWLAAFQVMCCLVTGSFGQNQIRPVNEFQPIIGQDYFDPQSSSSPPGPADLPPIRSTGGTWTQRVAHDLAERDRWQQLTSLGGETSERDRRVGRFFDPQRDRVFPILGNLIRKAGYGDALPNPWGVGVNIAYMDQPMDIEQISLDVAGGGAAPIPIPPFQIQSRDTNVSSRIDLWFLPFINIYGILGQTRGTAVGMVDISGVTGIPDGPIPIRFNYSGPTYGGGATIAGAYENIFFVLDMNYSLTDLEGLDRAIRARNFGPRIGIAGETTQFWVGGFLLNTDKQLGGTVDVSGTPVTIQADIGVTEPWNFIYGFRWSPVKTVEFMVEHGFGRRNQVIGGAAIRF